MATTPMMQQYLELKKKNPDCVLFFRLGDFYEMFHDEARKVAKELNLTLTTRDRNKSADEQTPMCGIPYHAAEGYIGRLVQKGYKVAIVEQIEDPSKATGLVQRDVVRIITPGTVMANSMLNDACNNYFGCVYGSDGAYGIAFCDISTGEFYATACKDLAAIRNEMARFAPKEMLLGGDLCHNEDLLGMMEHQLGCVPDYVEAEMFGQELCGEVLEKQFGVTLAELGVAGMPMVIAASGALVARLTQRQRAALPHVRTFTYFDTQEYLELDATARRNLELTETMRGREKRGTLLWVLDKTGTAMGGRMLRSWMEKPLISVKKIQNRLNAVEELTQNTVCREEIIRTLRQVTDLERIMARTVTGSASPRDLQSMSEGLGRLPTLRQTLGKLSAPMLRELYDGIDELADTAALIDAAIDDEPAPNLREGNVIRKGYSEELDRLRQTIHGGKNLMAEIEAREKEATGIKNLRVIYSRVFGYCIEISKGQTALAPVRYTRKQTLTNCERYVTQELSELESTILGAKDQALELENRLYRELLEKLAAQAEPVQNNSHYIAVLDCLCSFAAVAVANRYCRPEIDTSGDIEIKEGRHPVVEQTLKNVMFVPNSTHLSIQDSRTAVITGPNMAGKSTYMRQTALIVLMAQMGSFVPAKSARIGIVDKLFTRIGASDDLAAGQSTFMVEMTEMANILRNATPRSLLILDEIGRGTSTFDGMAIARAVLEYVTDRKKLGAKTLFATHYHELADAAEQLEGVRNYNVAVKKRGREIVFLRRILPGAADNSFGVDVARLAGLPDAVIRRGHEILQQLESGAVGPQSAPPAQQDAQVSMLELQGSEITRRLAALQVDALTPIEALNELYRLKQLLPKD